MRVEQDVKLTFNDVLIRPKRSTLVSRSDVNLEREFSFRHSDEKWCGIPIVSANMDTTGLFSVAKVLQKYKMLTCTQKFYSTKEFVNSWEEGVNPEYIAITRGSTENSLELVLRKIATHAHLKMLCIAVATG